MKSPTKPFIILLLWLFLSISLSFADDNKNYCHDAETWIEWDNLIKKAPNNMDIHFLHAVRTGLCRKVDEGTISFEKAKLARENHEETSEL